jgi:hypothetical protein
VPAVLFVPVLAVPLAAGFVIQVPAVPLAEQLVGLFVALQLTVALPPVPIEVGESEMVTTGGEAATPELTVTLVLADPVPPAFAQLRL